MKHLSKTFMQLEWRRSRVLELSSQGYSQREIASKLAVDPAAVNRDIQFLRQRAQDNIQKHIHETVPGILRVKLFDDITFLDKIAHHLL